MQNTDTDYYAKHLLGTMDDEAGRLIVAQPIKTMGEDTWPLLRVLGRDP